MAIKIRRGTDTARLAVIFEEGEVVYTTDTKSFFIGDGVTAGGNQIGGTTAALLLKATVHNATGVTLTKGQVVYLNGNTGNKPNAVLAQANSEATSSKTIGLIILNISNNASGDIATDGLIGDLNTSAFVAGDLLWLSDSIAGGVTTIVPDTPNHAVFIGYVVRAHPTLGSILIHIQNGYELNEIHDVKITSVQNNDGLIYDSSLGYWKNSNTVTVQGNTFNAANKLVQLDGTAKLPAVDGSQLTNLPTPATPTLASVTTAGNTTTNAITVGGLTVDTDTLFVDATNNRVGIGTVTPSQPLHIIGRTRIASSTGTSLHLYNDGSTSLIDSLTNGNAAHDLRISAQNISFYSGASYGTVYAKLFNTGNFALGTNPTDAGYKLDVNGTARIQGTGTAYGLALLIRNSASATILSVRDDGAISGIGGSVAYTENIGAFYRSGAGSEGLEIGRGSGTTMRLFSGTANLRVFNNTGASINSASLNASAVFQIDSTTKGFLPPRMTTTQKNAIATPASGLVVYDTTLSKLCVYTSAWETITSL